MLKRAMQETTSEFLSCYLPPYLYGDPEPVWQDSASFPGPSSEMRQRNETGGLITCGVERSLFSPRSCPAANTQAGCDLRECQRTWHECPHRHLPVVDRS